MSLTSPYFDDVLARTMVTDHCWIWLGSRSTKGYGQIMRQDVHLQVHRIAYEAANGSIPDGMVIDHLCHDPAVCVGGTCVHRICVNPAHLAAVSNEDNASRQTPAAKTHCANGHEFTDITTGRTQEGHRYCRPCRAESFRRYRTGVHSVPPATLRQWAAENGIPVSSRGKFSKALVRAWNEAHPDRPYLVTQANPAA